MDKTILKANREKFLKWYNDIHFADDENLSLSDELKLKSCLVIPANCITNILSVSKNDFEGNMIFVDDDDYILQWGGKK